MPAARKARAKVKRKVVKTPAQALTPKSTRAEPGEERVTWAWLPQKVAGVPVTEDTALTYGAVWACVRVIAEAVAALPWAVFRKRSDNGRDRLATHPVDWLLGSQPNEETLAFIWRETMLAHVLTWGNGYAEIERDAAGRPVALWIITPDRVEPSRTSSGRIVYDVKNPTGPNTVLEAPDVYHAKGLGFDGLVGYSVIAMHARSIGVGIAADTFAGNYFENDSTPGGLLKHKSRLSDKARTNLTESWEKRHAGQKNRRKVAILEEGLEWQQTGLPPEDSQLIETRQFSVTDIARIFKVPPHKIGDLSRATFSNIESEELSFQTDTLLPWVVRLEQESNIKLFSLQERGQVFTKLNLMARLRADSAARGVFYQQMLDRGVFSINDVRTLEDQNPVPDGDARFVPLNMQLLETAANPPEPEPEPAPAPPDEPAPVEEEETPEEEGDLNAQTATMLLADAFGRILRREEHRTQDAAKRKQGAALEAWAETFADEQAVYARDTLKVPLHAAGYLLRADPNGHAGEFCLGEYKQDVATRAAAAQVPAATMEVHYAERLLSLLRGEPCQSNGSAQTSKVSP